MSKKRMDVNWERDVKTEDFKPALKRFRMYLKNNGIRASTIDMYVFRAGKYLEFAHTDAPSNDDFLKFRDMLEGRVLSRSTFNNYFFSIKKYHEMLGNPIDFHFIAPKNTITADKNQMDKIMAVLTARGGKITKKELMRATHLKKKDMDECLESLKESDEIQLVTVSNPHGPASVWVIMGAGNEKMNKVNNVNTDITSIQSHQGSEDDVDGMCDGIDGLTNATKCDDMPIDADPQNTCVVSQ